jgi:protein Tex
MELRGTVLNVVDFGAFVDVGLSDSGLIHISQLSAGYVRDPHDVVAVGDQVRAWVSAIDKDRRRVALTMIAPGTERPKPQKSRGRGRRQDAPQQAQPQPQGPPTDGARKPPERAGVQPRRGGKPRGDRRGPPQRQPRTGAYEKRAPKQLVPITKEMEEGKAYLRSFGDLLQFAQKKKEHENGPEQSGQQSDQAGNSNGTTT